MTTAFPGAIDAFTNPTAGDPLDSVTVPHAAQHADLNDAVEAIETAIGTTGTPVLAPLASPTFTGTPAAPTAAPSTNTTQIATTAFVLANAGAPPFGYTPGLYYRSVASQTSATAVHNQTVYAALQITKTNTFDRIAIEAISGFAGTGVVRLGIYNNDVTTGKPSTVLLDAGTVSVTAAGIFQITISQSLNVGNYWVAFNMQTAATTPLFRGIAPTAVSGTGYVVSTTGSGSADAGIWLQASVTGAFATAGTLTSIQLGSTAMLRST